MNFKILEQQTADLKLRAGGKTKEELFANTAQGMMTILQSKFKKTPVQTREVKVESTDLANLLVDFLNELLYLMDVNQECYTNYHLEIKDDKLITGKLSAVPLLEHGLEIKAATYNDLLLEQRGKKWVAEVVFDI